MARWKVVVALNAFKEGANAVEACQKFAEGLREGCPRLDVLEVPIGDGGDGTLEALAANLPGQGEMRTLEVPGPRFRPVQARVWVFGTRAYVEMAEASGLKQVPPEERDPYQTTSMGTGVLIQSLIEEGIQEIYLGVGGSATVDGGLGALSALGFQFLDRQGQPVDPTGRGLIEVQEIRPPEPLPEVKITVLTDVQNPLLGPDGAARVYGPQKGATPEQVEALEQGLSRLRALIQGLTGVDVNVPGAGAAGGIAGSFYGLIGAKLESGIEVFLDLIQFDRKIQGARWVITGEGKFDYQTAFGKGPWGVLQHALAQGIPVIVVAGQVEDEELHDLPEKVSVFSILRGITDLQTAIRATPHLLHTFGVHLGRLLCTAC